MWEQAGVPKRAGRMPFLRIDSLSERITSGCGDPGVTLSGEKANDMLPNEPGGDSRLMPPKPLMSVNLSGRLLIHDGQTPIEKCYR